ncbi:hypothetical protein HPMG_01185 [Helicobacter pullorum MIT 98-5489]|uniref:Uncharacterized protein n=2 Tax=Helicobacter pullorum TaxID=35818 RepID=C5F0D4_9HELI|nr:hypothetical protein [Helicobacter pullorum]EAL0720664.1 hypothetical protein [Campylobacter jejuni]EEQ63728.1 hypothetical protein HPMG_01185 [Helicobacter pullorum MIT 98-5489]KPH55463.1 hypothetical protein HPU229334_08440 [Helicobacter pullorum]
MMSDKNSEELSNEGKHLCVMFDIGNIYTYAKDILVMINNRDENKDWSSTYEKLEIAKKALKEVFNELYAEKNNNKGS